MTDSERTGERAVGEISTAAVDSPPPNIFISYRRGPEGDAGWAGQLNQALCERFGSDNVFFDTDRIEGGDDFTEAITAEVSKCGVLIAVIGPNWTRILKTKRQQPLADFRRDFVKLEIETAFRRWPETRIIPVLVDEAPVLAPGDLPRTLKRLANLDAEPIRHRSRQRDLDHLLERLASRTAETPTKTEAAVQPSSDNGRIAPEPRPDERYLNEVARWMLESHSLVSVLGPGVNAVGRDGAAGQTQEYLPDAVELAKRLVDVHGWPEE